MDKIKIGKKEYDIKNGDYILDNGSCFMFFAGDKRILKREKWNIYSYLEIPKSVLNKIDLTEMNFVRKENLKYYFFT